MNTKWNNIISVVGILSIFYALGAATTALSFNVPQYRISFSVAILCFLVTSIEKRNKKRG